MKRWPMYLVHVVEALVVLAVVYFEPTYSVRGQLWGEPFFHGRSSSYWAAELENWEVSQGFFCMLVVDGKVPPMRAATLFQREPTWLEKVQARLPFGDKRVWIDMHSRPEIFSDEPEARAVLQELVRHDSPKVARLATIGLGLDPEFPLANAEPNNLAFPLILQDVR